MYLNLIIFLILNFIALGIGGNFTKKGVPSLWYKNLNKAPWTPPGWVFGVAWTLIMICFAFYMAYALESVENRNDLIILFGIQWVLNILWNPIFFKFHQILFGLIIIIALAIIVGVILIQYYNILQYKSFLIAPYFVWLLVATSLNTYTYFKN